MQKGPVSSEGRLGVEVTMLPAWIIGAGFAFLVRREGE